MNYTILLVNDRPCIRRSWKQDLEAAGYSVCPAHDGEDALLAIAEHPIDVVILDEDLPDDAGIEVARCIKQFHPELPVILFTLDTDYAHYHSSVIDGSVIKSETSDGLKRMIKNLLGTRFSGTEFWSGSDDLPTDFALTAPAGRSALQNESA